MVHLKLHLATFELDIFSMTYLLHDKDVQFDPSKSWEIRCFLFFFLGGGQKACVQRFLLLVLGSRRWWELQSHGWYLQFFP